MGSNPSLISSSLRVEGDPLALYCPLPSAAPSHVPLCFPPVLEKPLSWDLLPFPFPVSWLTMDGEKAERADLMKCSQGTMLHKTSVDRCKSHSFLFCGWLYVCVGTHLCGGTSANPRTPVPSGQRLPSDVFLGHFATLFSRQGPLSEPRAYQLSRQAGQKAARLCPSPSLQCWYYGSVPRPWALDV